LYFTYNDKELYLTVEKNKINYQYLVNKLKGKYNDIQNNIQLLILTNNNNNCINLEEYLKSYKLKDGDKILLIAN
jgi:molybdopterin converting factor small subunit